MSQSTSAAFSSIISAIIHLRQREKAFSGSPFVFGLWIFVFKYFSKIAMNATNAHHGEAREHVTVEHRKCCGIRTREFVRASKNSDSE